MTPTSDPDTSRNPVATQPVAASAPGKETVSDAEAPILPAPDPPRKRIAFLVIHGIGQQRPYETLDQFGRGLLESFENDKGEGKRANWAIHPQLNICKDPEHTQKDWVRASYRLEPDRPVRFQSDSHHPDHTIEDISLFEYYWAPITQDKITYSGSLLFLIKAGIQPFLYMAANINAIGKAEPGSLLKVAAKEFIRQAFLFLPLILLLAATLAWLNSVAADAFTGNFKRPTATFIFTAVIIFVRYLYAYTTGKAFWQSLTARSGWQTSIFWRIFLGMLVIFNVFLWPVVLGWGLCVLAGLGSWIGSFSRWLPDHIGHWSNGLRTIAAHTAFPGPGANWHDLVHSFFFLDPSFSQYFSQILWLLLAWFVRSVLINFVGDVAVYVNASELAKNFAARAQILDECTATLTTILKQRIDPRDTKSDPAYDEVYVAGHSLGSVIAYDTINLLLDRARTGDTHPEQIQSADLNTLRGMVTFGSPLNKIFYFFRERTDPRAVLRNQTLDLLRGYRVLDGLKESVTGYLKFQETTNQDWTDAEKALDHNFRWINAYSVADPISGRLVFYDLQTPLNQKRFNYFIPGLAHLSYWKDSKFYTFVRQRLL